MDVTQPASGKMHHVGSLVLVFVVLLSAILFALYHFNLFPFDAFQKTDIHMVGYMGAGGALITVTDGQATTTQYSGFSVIDVASTHKKIYALLEGEPDSVDLYDVTDGTPVQLTRSGGIKDHLSISQDGAHLAFVVAKILSPETPVSLSVTLAAYPSLEERVFEQATFPLFINNSVLAFVTPNGIDSVSLDTKERYSFPVSSEYLTHTPVVAGKYVLLKEQVTGWWSVFSISQAFPLSLEAVGAIKDARIFSVGKDLHALRTPEAGGDVEFVSLDLTRFAVNPVGVIPFSLVPSRLE